MEELTKFVGYFIFGGLILSIVTYFGSREKGLIAAFFAMFPVVTALTLFTIYSEAGSEAVITYVKGLLLLTPVWLLYLLCMIYLLPKYGFWIALISGVFLYLVLALILVFKI
jgi:uncharacterized membrane protein (GlpM family)